MCEPLKALSLSFAPRKYTSLLYNESNAYKQCIMGHIEFPPIVSIIIREVSSHSEAKMYWH